MYFLVYFIFCVNIIIEKKNCFYRFVYAIHGIDDRYSVPLFHVILSERGDQWLMAHYTISSFLPCPAL